MNQLKYLPCLCGLSLLAGCAFSGQIADHAVAYNKTIEQSENEMLLLNILRASDQRPMHFTRISEFSGALDASASSDLTIPFGRNTTSPFQSVLTLSGSSKPTFKVQVLNTK